MKSNWHTGDLLVSTTLTNGIKPMKSLEWLSTNLLHTSSYSTMHSPSFAPGSDLPGKPVWEQWQFFLYSLLFMAWNFIQKPPASPLYPFTTKTMLFWEEYHGGYKGFSPNESVEWEDWHPPCSRRRKLIILAMISIQLNSIQCVIMKLYFLHPFVCSETH